jgi:hypothetical protein
MAVAFIVILAFAMPTYLQKVAHAQGADMPPYAEVKGYVDNLTSDYNAIVSFNDSGRPNFQSVKADFWLYHDTGNTFKVTAMPAVANDSTYVVLLFEAIGGNSPVVVIDNTTDFATHYGSSLEGELTVIGNFLDTFQNANIYYRPVIVIASTDITGDYMTNANQAAEYIYRQNEATAYRLQTNTSSLSSSTTTSGTPTSSTQSQTPSMGCWDSITGFGNCFIQFETGVVVTVEFVGILLLLVGLIFHKRLGEFIMEHLPNRNENPSLP